MKSFNGIAPELLIPINGFQPMRAAMSWNVSPLAIAQTVKKAMALSAERVAQIRSWARFSFLSDRENFSKAFGELIC